MGSDSLVQDRFVTVCELIAEGLDMDGKQKLEGARAFSRGVARHACPHATGSVAFEDWMDGWAQQKAADERAHAAHALQTQFARAS